MNSASKAPKLRLVADEPISTEHCSDDVEERLISAMENAEPVDAGLLHDHLIRVIETTLFRVMGGLSPEHEDLVQNALEQVIVTLRKKRFARACSLRSWASAITTNVALGFLRTRRTEGKYFDREARSEDQVTRRSTHDPEHDAQLQQDISVVRELLAELPVEQARTLLLHDAFGHELAEISVLTRASVAAAQSRLVRGRKKLRERLRVRNVKVREPG